MPNGKESLNILPDLLSRHPTTADSDPEYKLLNTKAVLPASALQLDLFNPVNFSDTFPFKKPNQMTLLQQDHQRPVIQSNAPLRVFT
ncbi:hypothetical protein DSO57_1037786 [Entomophthora muscae]|uniref:Uncharacterized protein n=1 Tax=Entomophthora muscae TaxID=34485 RepID=A0ACC2RPU7_9FUNG|nr:hypothetical protein DSO57_1037786 [Entomophthora muscae]